MLEIQVTFKDGTRQRFDANNVVVSNHGALIVQKVIMKRARLAGQPDEVTTKLHAILQPELWLRVDTVGEEDEVGEVAEIRRIVSP